MSPHATHGTTAAGVGERRDETPRQWIMGTEAFERRMPHHDGIKALWETRWKFPVCPRLSFYSPLSLSGKKGGGGEEGGVVGNLVRKSAA